MFGLFMAVFILPTPNVLDLPVKSKGTVRDSSGFVESGPQLFARLRGRIVAMFIKKGMTADQVERITRSKGYCGGVDSCFLSGGIIGSSNYYPEYGFFVFFELRKKKLYVTGIQFPR